MSARAAQRQSRVVWFEIPATDLDRAASFYQRIFDVELKIESFGPTTLAVFPYEPPAIGGALVASDTKTSGEGPIVYLNADPNLNAVLGRVEAAGGTIVLGRTALPEGMGFYAKMRDTEGNVVGLHAVD